MRLCGFILFIFFLFNGCEPSPENVSPRQDNPSPDTTLETPHPENDERQYWQKPEVVLSSLGDIRDKTIADLGAGIGYFSFKLLPAAGKVIAIDVDTNKINILRGFKSSLPERLKSKLDIRLATPDDPGLFEKEADIILIVNTIAYIDNRVTYLERLRSDLSEGGRLLIVDFKTKRIPEFVNAPPYNERVYLHVLEDQLIDAGYDIIFTDDTSLEYQFMILAE